MPFKSLLYVLFVPTYINAFFKAFVTKNLKIFRKNFFRRQIIMVHMAYSAIYSGLNKKRTADPIGPTVFSLSERCVHRRVCAFPPIWSVGRYDRRLRGEQWRFFMIVYFFCLILLYLMRQKYAITELYRFEYSLEIICLRNNSVRLHNSDKNDNSIQGRCKKFLCTFFTFLHNIM